MKFLIASQTKYISEMQLQGQKKLTDIEDELANFKKEFLQFFADLIYLMANPSQDLIGAQTLALKVNIFAPLSLITFTNYDLFRVSPLGLRMSAKSYRFKK